VHNVKYALLAKPVHTGTDHGKLTCEYSVCEEVLCI